MNLLLKVLVGFLILQSAYAGTVNGGGGKGVVCRNISGEIKSVEMLDLWESEKMYGTKAKISNAPINEQVEQKLDILKNIYRPGYHASNFLGDAQLMRMFIAYYAEPFLREDTSRIKYLNGVNLAITDDSFEIITPSETGCKVEQIVIYQDNPKQILINKDIYDRMNATQKAALILHEGLYTMTRQNGFFITEKNSIRIRRIIGQAFANTPIMNIEENQISEFATCLASIDQTETSRVDFFRVTSGPLVESGTVKKDALLYRINHVNGVPRTNSFSVLLPEYFQNKNFYNDFFRLLVAGSQSSSANTYSIETPHIRWISNLPEIVDREVQRVDLNFQEKTDGSFGMYLGTSESGNIPMKCRLKDPQPYGETNWYSQFNH